MATRLSQGLPSASILIIEAGPYVTDNLDINVPGLRGKTLGTIYDWVRLHYTSILYRRPSHTWSMVHRGEVANTSATTEELHNCAGRGARQPHHPHQPWEGGGRVLCPQRADMEPCRGGRVRCLGGAREPRVELGDHPCGDVEVGELYW